MKNCPSAGHEGIYGEQRYKKHQFMYIKMFLPDSSVEYNFLSKQRLIASTNVKQRAQNEQQDDVTLCCNLNGVGEY